MGSPDYLRQPIDRLIVPADQVLPPPGTVLGWPVDPAGPAMLTTWGLPRVGDGNLTPDPAPGPHHERYEGAETFRIAEEQGAPVCVVAGSGRVVRLGTTGTVLINTALDLYVEAAWRYRWVFAEESGGNYDDDSDDVLDAFLAAMRQLDPGIGDDPDSSYWPGVVEYW